MKVVAILAVLSLVIAMGVSTVVHYAEWREHGAWCMDHSRPGLESDRAPGDVMAAPRTPKGCP